MYTYFSIKEDNQTGLPVNIYKQKMKNKNVTRKHSRRCIQNRHPSCGEIL